MGEAKILLRDTAQAAAGLLQDFANDVAGDVGQMLGEKIVGEFPCGAPSQGISSLAAASSTEEPDHTVRPFSRM